jgi:hypothetical protein
MNDSDNSNMIIVREECNRLIVPMTASRVNTVEGEKVRESGLLGRRN